MTRVVRRRHVVSPMTGSTGAGLATLQEPSDPRLDVPRRRFRTQGKHVVPHLDDVEVLQRAINPAAPGIDAASGVDYYDDESVPRTIPLLPGEKTLARRIKFGVANGCTIASLMLGMSAIFLSMHHNPRIAAALLVGCVVFDGLDGAVARKLGVASPFGAQMDSLADMCSFGMAAPVVVYASMRGEAPGWLIAIACGMIAAGAAIRLARFNVSPKDGRFFSGVPTTMTAAVMGIAVLVGLRLPGAVAVAAVAVLAIAMVSGFPYAKVARLVKLPVWIWIAPVAGMFIDFQATFAILVAIYVVSGPLLWLRQRNSDVRPA
jgi:CDP-diacylglycerol---serine O-phosphatidyltransferase